MTCIAFDGVTMAADKRACYGDVINTVTKIWRVEDATGVTLLVGGAGEATFVYSMVEWIRRGRKVEEFPSSQSSKDDWQPVMVVERGGRAMVYERTPYPVVAEQQHVAIGSGKSFARAAMFLGCDARRAVEVAIAMDVGCGNGIDTLTLE